MAAYKDAVVKRMWTVKSLIAKNKVTWVEGRGRLDGPTKVRVLQPGEDGTPERGASGSSGPRTSSWPPDRG
jgi:pyruvate/2-oxoglutarate dehydrogenase complex dihydrolipoamide dehydrogenase (E3) component